MSEDFDIRDESLSTAEKEFENALRPLKFADFNGQKNVVENLGIFVEAAKYRGEPLDHTLLYGPPGLGKTTLSNIIANELGVGFNPELTGRENVYLNGALLGFTRTEIDAMYDDIVEFAELEDFMDQKLKNYSSGMQVRLAFSVAIKAQGDILVLDEVLAVGDEAFQRKCDDFFTKVKKDPTKTVILVTHSMGGLVARQYSEKMNGRDTILGIVHGVMPDLGSPAAYRRMKTGERGVVGAVIGADAANLMPVLAQSPGPLQLLPGKAYGPDRKSVV